MRILIEILAIAVVSVPTIMILRQFGLHEDAVFLISLLVGLLTGRLVDAKIYKLKRGE